MNNSKAFIRKYFHNQGKDYSFVQWGKTVSMFGVGGLLGSIIGPKIIGNYCGRRATLLMNNVFLLVSSFLMVFAREWWWQAIGRVLMGIVARISTAVVTTYFSEISPIPVCRAVGTMYQLSITVSNVLAEY